MQTPESQVESRFDAIIIGGGPAGSSCALWLKMLGYKPCILEIRSRLGGLQNESPYPNQWIAVLPGFIGQQVAASIQENISRHGISYYLNSTVTAVEIIENEYRVHFADSEKLSYSLYAPHLVIASGVTPISGGLRPSDNVLIGPGEQIVNYSFADKRVAILGGGDNAFENYEFIKQQGAKIVHIYAQHDKQHAIKARYEFLARVPKEDIFLHQGQIDINSEKNTVNNQKYDILIALYGWTACLSFLSHFKLKLNEKGFIETNPHTAESSQRNVYAIGEVAQRAHPCCVTAMADGVIAAKAIQYQFELAKKKSLLFLIHA